MDTALASWHDFYLGLLRAVAALTGLLFVALSLNLRAFAAGESRELRGLAQGVFSIYVLGFATSALALVPQTLPSFAVEITLTWLLGLTFSLILVGGIRRHGRGVGVSRRGYAIRTAVGYALGIPITVGIIAMNSGAEWGLAVFSVAFLIFLLRALYESFELVLLAARASGA